MPDATVTSQPANPPSRRRDAQANLARIVAAASELLVHDPDVPVGTIARHAGVGRSTLYRHFSTREALVDAVRRRARDLADTDETQALRPAGELANRAPTPLSVTDVLNKVAPYQVGQQVVAEAQRLAGVQTAAIYVVDLQGRQLRRLAGPTVFPEAMDIRGAVGVEIPREAFDAVRARLAEQLRGALVAPLILRGRALGLLVVVGAGDDALRDLAREAAAALAVADGYTDAVQTARRARGTSPAAEIQQNLLPARIVRVGGASLAGNVLPGYEVGGDWFDFADNADCVWIGLADVDGSGPRAAGLGAVLLGAFRSGRHQGEDPAGVVAIMHDVLRNLGEPPAVATSTVGCWNPTTSVFRWAACGTPGPLLIDVDGDVVELAGGDPPLGDPALALPVTVHERTLLPGQRLVFVSDGVLEARDPAGAALGLQAIRAAARQTLGASAAVTVHAIETLVTARDADRLDDDATVSVLAVDPAGMSEH